MKLLILAGGMSSRMKKNNDNIQNIGTDILEQANLLPKSMIGLGKNGRPFLDYVLHNAWKGGVREVILLLNPKDTFSQEYYEKLLLQNKLWGLEISFARQLIPEGREKPMGTTDAILQALSQFPHWKKDTFIVCNGDNLYPILAFELLIQNNSRNAMLDWDSKYYEVSRTRNCAIIMKDKEEFLVDLIEKPNDDEWKNISQSMPRIGISWNIFKFFAPDVLPFLENTPLHPIRNEKELPVTVRRWIQDQKQVIKTIPIDYLLPDLTSKEDIPEVQKLLDYEPE